MKAVVCKELGRADKLIVDTMDTPKLSKGEVLIDVKASGLNFPDTLIIQGIYQFKPDLPFIPGGEGAGVIAAVGDGVTNAKVGDRVIFNAMVGGLAEQIVVSQHSIIPIPDKMPFEVAAGFTITYATSYNALKQRANLQKGEHVLVLGAAGGVGLATIELAKAMGAVVIAAASTAEKLEVCKQAGADYLINYTDEDLRAAIKEKTGRKDVDVIYDPVGGDFSEAAFRSIAPNGRHLVIGFAAGDIPKMPLNLCLLKQASLVGVFWGAWAAANPTEQMNNMQEMFAMFNEGRIDPLVNDIFTIDQFQDAFECLTGRKARGKVIIKMS